MSIPHHDWVRHHARTAPKSLALVDLAAGRRLGWAQLDDRVARLAGHLRDVQGIRRGDRVAALAQNCGELFELLFACARLGAIYLPLNWRLSVPELVYILGNAEPSLLVAEREFAATADALRQRGAVPALLEFDAAASWGDATLTGVAPVDEPEPVTHDDVQMLMYTSGTTGFPKGAMITFGMSFWNAINVGLPIGIGPASRTLTVMPMFHTGGLNLFAMPVLHAGGTVVTSRGFDADATLAALADPALAITHFFAVPTAYLALATHPRFPEADLGRLAVACVGGAATPPPVLERWAARGIALANGYGMTETSPAVSLLLPADAARKQGSVGRPLLHTEIRVVRGDGGEAGVDEAGELWVRGPNVTPGYWRDECATAAALAGGWLRTGDVVRRDAEGFCYIVDRAKDMYISGGENVYPAEVEAVLARLDGVAEAAVIGVPDPRWGEVGLALVVVRAGAVLAEDAVIAHCAASLARFKLPRRVLFVERLPRTVTGKVHKPTLREQHAGARS